MITRQPVYPMFPAASWWPLRRQFKRRMPAVVDAEYLATVLGIEVKTARNLLPTLKHFGLLHGDGAPTERAHRWRLDGTYAEICRELRHEIYPQDLFAQVPDPAELPDRAVGWFMRETGVGEAAARRMARLYELLMDADPEREEEFADRRRSRTIALKRSARAADVDDIPPMSGIEAAGDANPGSGKVELHFHFESGLTPQQIEKIFQSMGQYLAKK